MIIVEMNEGQKVEYALKKNKLTFAEALTLDLAKYQRDYVVLKDIMADGDGNLLVGNGGRYYVAQVEIPAIEYKETEKTETNEQGEETTVTEREPLPLDTDKVTLRLWSVAGIEIF